MTLKIKRTNPNATLPQYAHPGEDACFDLRVLIDDADAEPFRHVKVERRHIRDTDRVEDAEGLTYGIVLRQGESAVLHTGLSCEIPAGYAMKIYVRSSVGITRHLALSNGTGIIDCGYRGEILIGLTNFGGDPVTIMNGERIAQAEICRVEPVQIEEVDDLSASERGSGGIGSSGK